MQPPASNRGAKSPTASGAAAAVLVSAGVDWLTCTARDPARSENLRAVAWQLLYEQAGLGSDLKPWSWMGYGGYICGPIAMGERHDGCYCRLSGRCAHDNWRRCAVWADNVSRIDLQCTVRLPDTTNPAALAYAAVQHPDIRRRGRAVTTATHIENTKRGETTYIGSRSSDRMGRLYNKGVESKEEVYRDCWRWEIEYKNRAAPHVSGWLSLQPDDATAVAATVHRAYADWGAPPDWRAGALDVSSPPARQQTDDERRLAWLYAQVRPVVAGLTERGRLVEVVRALGLEAQLI